MYPIMHRQIDMRYYKEQIEKIPPEVVNPSAILSCMLDQVIIIIHTQLWMCTLYMSMYMYMYVHISQVFATPLFRDFNQTFRI